MDGITMTGRFGVSLDVGVGMLSYLSGAAGRQGGRGGESYAEGGSAVKKIPGFRLTAHGVRQEFMGRD
jgi:hypothetical protein